MLLGLLQNDARLLPCRLAQLRDLIQPHLDGPPDAVGAGYIENGEALVRRRPGTAPALASDLLELVNDVRATGLIVHARQATVGGFKDENTHPFRYRNWLFAHGGTVARFGDLRPALMDGLPSFLQRMIGGETDSEHVFALFLDELHRAGVLETVDPAAHSLGRALAATVERVEVLTRSVGETGPSPLNIVATNGRAMVACRHGNGPDLKYAVMGGLGQCPLHSLTEESAETHAQRLPHHNMRSVVVASRLKPGSEPSWEEIPKDHVLVVAPDLTTSLIES